MKDAAIGVRMHSGWGALIAVDDGVTHVDVLQRRKIAVTDPQMPGANQPYHHAARLDTAAAEEYVRGCAEISHRLALAAVRSVTEELRARQYRVTTAAILLASGRALPALCKVLASHPLIHTAEGEFFRRAVWNACQGLELRVTGIRERELEERTWALFGKVTPQLQRRIEGLKSSVGAPWTEDQKKACLAACLALKQGDEMTFVTGRS